MICFRSKSAIETHLLKNATNYNTKEFLYSFDYKVSILSFSKIHSNNEIHNDRAYFWLILIAKSFDSDPIFLTEKLNVNSHSFTVLFQHVPLRYQKIFLKDRREPFSM